MSVISTHIHRDYSIFAENYESAFICWKMNKVVAPCGEMLGGGKNV